MWGLICGGVLHVGVRAELQLDASLPDMMVHTTHAPHVNDSTALPLLGLLPDAYAEQPATAVKEPCYPPETLATAP